jgi:nickel/cobalt transporter (NiCoT) family protein
MSLMDTADSTIMVGTYGWAFVNPIRKLHYNMTVTLASIVAALGIGGIETLSLIGDKFALQGPLWRSVARLSENLGLVGYLLVAFFVVCWLASYLLYKFNDYDEVSISAEPRR